MSEEINGHRWGFKDTAFEIVDPKTKSVKMTGDRYNLAGYEIPQMVPFIEDTFQVRLDVSKPKPDATRKPLAKPKTNAAFLKAITPALRDDQLSTEESQRLIHSHGQTTADEVYKVLYGEIEKVCDLVVFLETEQQAAAVIKAADEHNICVVPYGGGTSVSCALKLPAGEQRMIVVMNTRGMNRIEWLDTENMKASVQAGISGKELEEELGKRGYTCGHEPDSIELSTLGGWIATNASGMKKNRYGNIEDVVKGVTMITPKGEVRQLDAHARVSVGVQPKDITFGSEGNLGLITSAVIKVHKKPEVTKYNSLVFADWSTGVSFMRELGNTGILPASIRLVDNIQFRSGNALKPAPTFKSKAMSKAQKTVLLNIKKFEPYELVAATIVMEGSAKEVAWQDKHIKSVAKKFGAVVGGPSNGKRGYMLTYAIAYIRDFLASYDIIGETYETTVPWDKVEDVCDAVLARAKELHEEYDLPGVPYVSPRLTQIYHTGACIYFTHGFCTQGVEDPATVFSEIEHSLRETILETGGSLSHHHGIGKLRKDFMSQVLSKDAITMLQGIKKSIDPNNTFGIANNVMES